MRILQVTHLSLPESTGGTEVHVHLLSRALQARHKVAVCAHLSDGRRREHELLRDNDAGLPVYRLVNNFTWGGDLEYFFFDPGQEAPFEAVLDEVRPDIVHFHHLGGGLSTSFPELVDRRGVPMVLSLHDFWPMCYRSHLLNTRDELCPGPEDGLRCAACFTSEAELSAGVRIRQRLQELGGWQALRRAPRFTRDWIASKLSRSPSSYHTTRLMVRDTYFRRLLSRFDLLIAPSEHLRRRFVAWGLPGEQIRLVRNGVSEARFDGLRTDLPNGERLCAIYYGSLLPHKGLDVLVEAANYLVDAPVDLRIYGHTDGTELTRRYVGALRERLRNSLVSFKGPFAPDQIGMVLSLADLVVVPSILYENCPMAILEALYARRPVLASNVGGMAELVRDGVNGRTFQVGDAADLASHLRTLAEDRGQLLALQAGIAPPATAEEVAAQIEGLYAEVLAARQGEGCAR